MHSLKLVAVAGILAVAASCSSSTGPGGGGGGGGGGACSGTNASPAVCDNFFSPNVITATHGNSVTFTFKGHIGHNVTWDGGPTSPANSAIMSSGQFTSDVLAAGTYTFHCIVHGPAMSGTINVN